MNVWPDCKRTNIVSRIMLCFTSIDDGMIKISVVFLLINLEFYLVNESRRKACLNIVLGYI